MARAGDPVPMRRPYKLARAWLAVTEPSGLFGLDLPGGDYEELHVLQDGASGLRAIIAIHDTTLGPGAGGIRRRPYPTQGAGLADALALARAMSIKCALADLPAGGAKAVILDHDGLDPAPAYRALGQAIDRLDGHYLCGPDLGTGEAELEHVRAVTDHVNPPGNAPNEATARGVLAGIRGLLEVMPGAGTPEETTFLVQGLGGVGGRVAKRLTDLGATVLGSDLEEEACQAAAAHGVELLDPNETLGASADILVPCAVGGIVSEKVVDGLQVDGICGPANNQLATEAAGRRLHERGILLVPDALASAGAVIEGVLTTRDGMTRSVRQAAAEHIDGIQDRVVELLETAVAEDRPPTLVAARWAEQRLHQEG